MIFAVDNLLNPVQDKHLISIAIKGIKVSTITLQDIHVYPIKSTAGIALSTSWVDNIGLPFDRRFVVSDQSGQFITARTEPKLCLIQANITDSGLVITAPDMPVLTIDFSQCLTQYQEVTVWKDRISAQRCAENIDLWFSQYLQQNCQLMYFGEASSRKVAKSNNPVAFADGYPLLLISQPSLDDLNARLSVPVTMAHFRPNLVVQHCELFEEDTWQHIRIGEVEFELTKPCSRCIFTTVNPITGDKHPQMEPLKTLKGYRQVLSGDVMFGQNLIPLNKGQIKKGDTLTVMRNGAAPQFLPAKSVVKKSIKNIKKKQGNASFNNEEHDSSLTLICQKVIAVTHDVNTFVFKHKTGKTYPYQAGQHLPFTLDIQGKATHAVYTLSSSPTRIGHLAITVKRVPNGLVSNYLHDHFTVGDTIKATPPAGHFHLGNINPDKVLLLSAGSGVTPMLSMLKAMTDQALKNDIVFLHSAKTAQDIITRDEVAALANQHGQCQVSYTLTRNAPPTWQDYQSHLNEEMLHNIADITEREVMVCGPEAFREQAQNMLFALGLPEQQFHVESFGKRFTQPEPTLAKQKSRPKTVNISFNSWDKVVKGNTHETLLEQGESAGLILPYSCRGGMCGSCKVKLVSGDVEQLADDGLMRDEEEQGYVLACSCIPLSDVVINKE